MPHIVFEYSGPLENKIDVKETIKELHETLKDQGIDEERIKSRAIKLENYYVGTRGEQGLMAHTTLSLLSGRSLEVKDEIGKALYRVLKESITEKVPDCVLTLELRDMDAQTYFK